MSSVANPKTFQYNVGMTTTGFITGVKTVQVGLNSMTRMARAATTGIGSLGTSSLSTTKGMTSGFTSANKAMATFGVTAGSVQAIVAQLATVIMSSLGEALSYAIERLDALSIYPKVMQNLGYSADEANDSISEIMDELEGLPVAADTVTNTTKQIVAFCDSLEQATDYSLAFTDAFLASGTTSTTDLRRGMTQMQQMMANGEPDFFGWRTVSETMSVALQQVATELLGTDEANKKTKKSAWDLYDAIDAGTVTWDEFIETLDKANKKGVAGYESLKEQALDASNTIATAMQLVVIRSGAAITNFLGAALGQNDTGVADEYTSNWERADGRIATCINNISKNIRALGEPLGNIVHDHLDAIQNLGSAFLMVGSASLAFRVLVPRAIRSIPVNIASGLVDALQFMGWSFMRLDTSAVSAAGSLGKIKAKFAAVRAAVATAATAVGVFALDVQTGLATLFQGAKIQSAKIQSAFRLMGSKVASAFDSVALRAMLAFDKIQAKASPAFDSVALKAMLAFDKVKAKVTPVTDTVALKFMAMSDKCKAALAPLSPYIAKATAKLKKLAIAAGTTCGSAFMKLGKRVAAAGAAMGGMAISKVKGGFTSLIRVFGKFGKMSIVGIIIGLVTWLMKLYNSSKKLQNAVKKLGNAFTGGFSKGLKQAGGAVSSLSDAIGGKGNKKTAGSLADFITGFTSGVGKAAQGLAAAIGPIANTIVDFLSGFSKGFTENFDAKGLKSTVNVIKNTLNDLKTAIFGEDDGEGSGNKAKKNGKGTGTVIADTLNSIIKAVRKAAQFLKKNIPIIKEKIEELKQAITDFVTDFTAGFTSEFDEAGFEDLKTSISEVGDSFGELWSTLTGGDSSSGGGKKKGKKKSGAESAGTTVATVVNGIIKVLTLVVDVINAVIEVATWLFVNIVRPIVIPLVKKVIGFIKTVAAVIKTVLTKLWEVYKFAKNKVGQIISFFKNLKRKLVAVFTAIGNAIQTALDALTDFFNLSDSGNGVTIQGDTYTVTGTGSTGSTSVGESMADSTGTISGMSSLSTSSLSTMSAAVDDATSSLSAMSTLSSSLSSLSTTSSLSATRTRRALSSSNWERVGSSSKLALADVVSARESERSTTTNNVSAPVTVQGASPEQIAAAVVRRINLAL